MDITEHPLLEVELPNELMHSDDMLAIVTCGDYPTMYREGSFPECVVVWDHGEGPHNPERFSKPYSQERGWRALNVYPQWVWDEARKIVLEQYGSEDVYCHIWLRGDEQ